jgi:hypothetical protein
MRLPFGEKSICLFPNFCGGSRLSGLTPCNEASDGLSHAAISGVHPDGVIVVKKSDAVAHDDD